MVRILVELLKRLNAAPLFFTRVKFNKLGIIFFDLSNPNVLNIKNLLSSNLFANIDDLENFKDYWLDYVDNVGFGIYYDVNEDESYKECFNYVRYFPIPYLSVQDHFLF